MIVVSDTSPICYLLLIDKIDLLPQLYKQVLVPEIVCKELAALKSPVIVQEWIQYPPAWLTIRPVDSSFSSGLENLDPGEVAAILLTEQEEESLLIIDDLLGRKVAASRGIIVTGLLGVLDAAAQKDLIDFPTAVAQLQKTTFRASSGLIQSLLQKYENEQK